MTQERVYGQFCPIAMGAEIFATRWTPLVLRELLLGSTRFSELHRGVPLMSRSLLAQRLRELETAGVVRIERSDRGRGADYRLTEAGEALRPVVMALGDWAHRWLPSDIPARNLDPALLMWDIRRNVCAEAVPAGTPAVIQFQLDGVAQGRRVWWLLVRDGEVELCYRWPGFDNDLEVAGHVRTLTEVWVGRRALRQALADGSIRLDGHPSHRAAFQHWFLLSPYAHRQAGGTAVADAGEGHHAPAE